MCEQTEWTASRRFESLRSGGILHSPVPSQCIRAHTFRYTLHIQNISPLCNIRFIKSTIERTRARARSLAILCNALESIRMECHALGCCRLCRSCAAFCAFATRCVHVSAILLQFGVCSVCCQRAYTAGGKKTCE